MQSPARESELALRIATAADLENIRTLASEIWRDVYSRMLPPGQVEYMLRMVYSPEALASEIAGGTTRYFLLCINDGPPRGYASLRPGERPGDVMLDKLYLHPSLHGVGHGSRVLGLLEDIARVEFGGAGISLRVNKGNRKAIRAYLRAGYAVTGRICTDIGGGFVMDDYWMTKAIVNSIA